MKYSLDTFLFTEQGLPAVSTLSQKLLCIPYAGIAADNYLSDLSGGKVTEPLHTNLPKFAKLSPQERKIKKNKLLSYDIKLFNSKCEVADEKDMKDIRRSVHLALENKSKGFYQLLLDIQDLMSKNNFFINHPNDYFVLYISDNKVHLSNRAEKSNDHSSCFISLFSRAQGITAPILYSDIRVISFALKHLSNFTMGHLALLETAFLADFFISLRATYGQEINRPFICIAHAFALLKAPVSSDDKEYIAQAILDAQLDEMQDKEFTMLEIGQASSKVNDDKEPAGAKGNDDKELSSKFNDDKAPASTIGNEDRRVTPDALAAWNKSLSDTLSTSSTLLSSFFNKIILTEAASEEALQQYNAADLAAREIKNAQTLSSLDTLYVRIITAQNTLTIAANKTLEAKKPTMETTFLEDLDAIDREHPAQPSTILEVSSRTEVISNARITTDTAIEVLAIVRQLSNIVDHP